MKVKELIEILEMIDGEYDLYLDAERILTCDASWITTAGDGNAHLFLTTETS